MQQVNDVKGIELSKRFFDEQVYPILTDEYTILLPDISVGLIGDGSEVLGFDDEFSHDHNYCPRVTILIEDKQFKQVGEGLEQRLLGIAPAKYLGYKLLYDESRKFVEVAPLQGFFHHQLGTEAIPKTDREWLKLEEQKLLELTVGPIFFDPKGRLHAMVEQLAFYPDAVRYFLLRQGFVRLSEVGAIERAILRGDWICMELYRAWFVYFAIKILHLQQRCYCPYRKWMGKNLEQLAEVGRILKTKIETLVRATDLTQISTGVTDILRFLGGLILKELGETGSNLSVKSDLFLINFDWDRVLGVLSRQIPQDLKELSPLVAPVAFWGQLFDFSGMGGNYAAVLNKNVHFLQDSKP